MSGDLDFRYYISVARRRFGYFVVPALLVLSIGAGIVTALPAIYNSSAKILVESQRIPNEFVKSTVTALATERLQVIQQRVTTRENLLLLADKFRLFAERKNISKTELVDLMQERITFNMLDLSMGAQRQRGEVLTVAFSIGFDYENANGATRVANELVTLILQEDIRNRTSRATETTDFLNRESERLATELVAMEATLANFKLKNSTTLPEKLTFNMNLLDRQERTISDIDRELQAASDQKRLLELEASVRQAPGAGKVAGGPAGDSLDQQLQSLQQAYSQRTVIFSDSHPEMRVLRRQISSMEKAIAEAKTQQASTPPVQADDPKLGIELRLIAQKMTAIDQSISLLTKQRGNLLKSVALLQDMIVKSPEVGAALSSLERRRESLQRNADDISAKLVQAKLGGRLEENQQAERFEVIEAPILPQNPIRPKRIPLMLLVVGASLAVGGASAFGAEFFNNTIRRPRDLTDRLNMRVLVVIPYIGTLLETRRKRGKLSLYTAIGLLSVFLGLLAIHVFYTPIDDLILQITTKVMSLIQRH